MNDRLRELAQDALRGTTVGAGDGDTYILRQLSVDELTELLARVEREAKEEQREEFHSLYTAACRVVSAENEDQEREAVGWLLGALNEFKQADA